MEIVNEQIYKYLDNGKLNIEKVIENYRNYIYTIIRRICINLSEEDMKEICIDTFFVLWKNQDKLDTNKPLLPYLKGVATNLSKSKLRSRNNHYIQDYDEELISNFDIEKLIINQENIKIIMNELKKLKSRDREIFCSYYYKNMGINEISKLYNLSISNIKVILFRIRKKIKKNMINGGYNYND